MVRSHSEHIRENHKTGLVSELKYCNMCGAYSAEIGKLISELPIVYRIVSKIVSWLFHPIKMYKAKKEFPIYPEEGSK